MYEVNVEWIRKNFFNYIWCVLILGVYENFKIEIVFKILIKFIVYELVMKCLWKVIVGIFVYFVFYIILFLMNKFWKEYYVNWGFVYNFSLFCIVIIL